jgi:thiol-disulfide isomerase/thioredoxin
MNRMAGGWAAAGMLAVMMLGFTGCGGAAQVSAGGTAVSPNANKPSEPDVTFEKLDGADLPLASLKGKVVLVNFWATWCTACREEIPWMIGFQQKYASQGFTILGVAMDDDGKKVVDPFVESKRFNVDGQQVAMSYPIIIGNYDLAAKFGGLIGLPTTIVISRDGKVVKRIIGEIDRDEMQGIIEEQLKLHS